LLPATVPRAFDAEARRAHIAPPTGVGVKRREGPTRGESGTSCPICTPRALVTGGIVPPPWVEDTLGLAHDRLIRLVEYYARLGHPIVDLRVTRACDTCGGRGQIATRRRDPTTGRKAKPCKACDGQGGHTLLLIERDRARDEESGASQGDDDPPSTHRRSG